MIPLVKARTVLRIALAGSAVLVASHLVAYWDYVRRGRTTLGAIRYLDLDFEATAAVWFGSSLLLAIALVLAGIAIDARASGDRYRRHWAALAVVFVYLSLDEAAQLHELLQGPLGTLTGSGGLLTYAWIVPGAIATALLGLAYLRFLRDLPEPTRRRTIVAAAIFVGGALVLEAYGGALQDVYGYDSDEYQLEVAAEEGFELTGASLFLWTMTAYAQERRRDRTV